MIGTFSTATAVSVGGGNRKDQWWSLSSLNEQFYILVLPGTLEAGKQSLSFLSVSFWPPLYTETQHVYLTYQSVSGIWLLTRKECFLASSELGNVSRHLNPPTFATYNSHKKSYIKTSCKMQSKGDKLRVHNKGKSIHLVEFKALRTFFITKYHQNVGRYRSSKKSIGELASDRASSHSLSLTRKPAGSCHRVSRASQKGESLKFYLCLP